MASARSKQKRPAKRAGRRSASRAIITTIQISTTARTRGPAYRKKTPRRAHRSRR